MKILNLYSGVGGNRKLWNEVFPNAEITSLESDIEIGKVYSQLFPKDKLILGDAHEYLLNNYQNYDIVWSSPPCQSHSRMIRSGKNRAPRYPDMKLYEEIILLQNNFTGIYVVENVIPYYGELIPAQKIGRHLFWSNVNLNGVSDVVRPKNFINQTTLQGREHLMAWLGFDFDKVLYYEKNHCPAQVLRNCVHPKLGKDIIIKCLEMGGRLKS